MNIKPGNVIICGSSQSGCVTDLNGDEACVLLLNGDLWFGSVKLCRLPQDAEDLASAPLNVDRFERR